MPYRLILKVGKAADVGGGVKSAESDQPDRFELLESEREREGLELELELGLRRGEVRDVTVLRSTNYISRISWIDG